MGSAEPTTAVAIRPAAVEDADALAFYERMGLTVDIEDAVWELGGVSCPIVRFVRSWHGGG